MEVVLMSKALEVYILLNPRIPLLGIYFKEIIVDMHKALAAKIFILQISSQQKY